MACFRFTADRKLWCWHCKWCLFYQKFYYFCRSMLASFRLRWSSSKNQGKRWWPVPAITCCRLWDFLHISLVYDNIANRIQLHPSYNQSSCNIQRWKIHVLLRYCKLVKPYCKYSFSYTCIRSEHCPWPEKLSASGSMSFTLLHRLHHVNTTP